MITKLDASPVKPETVAANRRTSASGLPSRSSKSASTVFRGAGAIRFGPVVSRIEAASLALSPLSLECGSDSSSCSGRVAASASPREMSLEVSGVAAGLIDR